jgi:hypothetical protein
MLVRRPRWGGCRLALDPLRQERNRHVGRVAVVRHAWYRTSRSPQVSASARGRQFSAISARKRPTARAILKRSAVLSVMNEAYRAKSI